MSKLLCQFLLVFGLVSTGNTHVVDYLLAFPEDISMRVVAGTTGGWFEVGSNPRVNLSGYIIHEESIANVTGKPVFLTANHVYMYVGSEYSMYVPMPIYALGKKYIVSSCIGETNYKSVLLIASHTSQADVTITFKLQGNIAYGGETYGNGEVLSVSLSENQTIIMESDNDLTGTVVASTNSIAVYSGTRYISQSSMPVVAYDQLIPVEHLGTEYVLAVDDNSNGYTLQVIGDMDSTVTFKNGDAESLQTAVPFEKTLSNNAVHHFTSTKPVMATLCRLNELKSGFLVVSPVSTYTTRKTLQPVDGDTVKLMKMKDTYDPMMQVNANDSDAFSFTMIPNSDYKIGTITYNETRYGSIRANSSLALMVFGENFIFNAGHRIRLPAPDPSTTVASATVTPKPSKAHKITGTTPLAILSLGFLVNQMAIFNIQ